MIDQVFEGDCLILKLNRPDKANALTEHMLVTLAGAVERTEARALIITGAGKVFSAGADLDDVRNGTLATSPAWERLSGAIANFSGISVVALNGAAAGGALGMVLAADLRISVPGASFFYPVIKMGVLPQPSDPARLAALIGPAEAKRMLLCGARLDANEALSRGLLQGLTEPDDLLSTARELVAPALAAREGLVGQIKALV